ncbi:MAG: hypothetical protein WBW73_04720 [Rhodoplanes sp.]
MSMAHVPRRGELAINTIAAQRALEHQSAALNAVFYERAVNPSLKNLILDPKTARTVLEVSGVTPTDQDFDDEKKDILANALGVQDFLTIEGPPGHRKDQADRGNCRAMAETKSAPQDTAHLTDPYCRRQCSGADHGNELVAGMIRIGRSDEPRISELGQKLLLGATRRGLDQGNPQSRRGRNATLGGRETSRSKGCCGRHEGRAAPAGDRAPTGAQRSYRQVGG